MRTGTDARHRFACHFPLAQTVGPAAVSGATDRGALAQ
jgi:hypothetical protein